MAENTTQQGEPSEFLRQAAGDGGAAFGYEPITRAQAEEGVFPVVGGFVDGDGVLHNRVHLRSMSGEEEDIWADDSMLFMDRLVEVLARCVKRYGTIEDPGGVRRAVMLSPGGTLIDMLLALRTFANYNEVGWAYIMEIECGSRSCRLGEAPPYRDQVDLYKVGKYQPPHPEQGEYTVTLPRAKVEVEWRRQTSAGERIIEAVVGNRDAAKSLATWSQMTRVIRLDGKDVSIGPDDVLDRSGRMIKSFGNREKLSKRAIDAHKVAKKMLSADRDFLRGEFSEHEPAIDRSVESVCPVCGYTNRTSLRMDQPGFLFPKTISTSSSRTFSSFSIDGE